VQRALESTAALCSELGHEVVSAAPDYGGAAFAEHFLDLWCSEPAALVEDLESRGIDPATVLEPATLGMAARYRARPADAMERAVAFFTAYPQRMDAFFEDHDAILSPVLRTPPILLGTQDGTKRFEDIVEPLLDYVSYTPVWNAAGNPAMSVPLAWSEAGLPIGSQFAARLGGEATLLALAYELEAARPWRDRLPPNPA
jgi:amidase